MLGGIPHIRVQVQGVPVYGIIDKGTDINIMGRKLFKKVDTITGLRWYQFIKAGKIY